MIRRRSRRCPAARSAPRQSRPCTWPRPRPLPLRDEPLSTCTTPGCLPEPEIQDGTGEVRSDDTDGIACWFIDTDYNEESFFVRHAYFLGANDPYKALKTTLKAEIDRDAWATLRSNRSRPFSKPEFGRIAVKVINHLGDEAMRVFRAVHTCPSTSPSGTDPPRYRSEQIHAAWPASVREYELTGPFRTCFGRDSPRDGFDTSMRSARCADPRLMARADVASDDCSLTRTALYYGETLRSNPPLGGRGTF